MRILANENFPYAAIFYLQGKGYDVLSIGIGHPGIKDAEVMAIAIEQNRVILTFDRDYGELIFKQGYQPACGVIYFRLDEYTPEYPGILAETILNDTSLNLLRALTVVDKNGIRQRKY